MEGWEGYRVVSSLIRMPSEHPEVMVWLLVSVLTHESAYGCRPYGAPLNMFTYPLMEDVPLPKPASSKVQKLKFTVSKYPEFYFLNFPELDMT